MYVNSLSLSLSLPLGGAAFVLPLPNDQQTVDVGTPSVLFDCLTDGNIPPVTNHSWTFNGTPISHDGSNYILYPNGSLAVNDVQPSNAGMYTCTPQNTLGSFNSSSVTLIVNGKTQYICAVRIGLSITFKAGVELLGWLWGAIAQWSEHLQLKQEALGSIPGGCLGFFHFQLAY